MTHEPYDPARELEDMAAAFEAWADSELLVIRMDDGLPRPLYAPNHTVWLAWKAAWEHAHRLLPALQAELAGQKSILQEALIKLDDALGKAKTLQAENERLREINHRLRLQGGGDVLLRDKLQARVKELEDALEHKHSFLEAIALACIKPLSEFAGGYSQKNAAIQVMAKQGMKPREWQALRADEQKG